jgi:type II secretory pathway pseudopilin PulG
MTVLREKGFSLIELLVFIGIVGLLASVILANLNTAREQARLSKAEASMRSIADAIAIYQNDHGGEMPPDADAALPADIGTYVSSGDLEFGPWAGSFYDWDNWVDPDDPSKHIWQVSLRFCPADTAAADCPAPKLNWATGFDGHSALYYCIEGACRPYESEPITHPGYCVNCND